MDASSWKDIALLLTAVGWYWIYKHKSNSSRQEHEPVFELPRSLPDVYANGFPRDPAPRDLGLSPGVISGRLCTPHHAVAEHQLLQFRRILGREPRGNEIQPGVFQWQTDGGRGYTTNTMDGSGRRTEN
jgi:hypothetical protein